MSQPDAHLDRAEIDALQELASVGCGQALTALGKLLHLRVDMDVPETWVGAGAGAIADFLGAMSERLVAVAVRLEGLLDGQLVLALPERDGRKLVACLGLPAGDPGWTPLAESALMESGNIVGSAFVSAIAAMVGETLLLSVPRLARGGGRDCMDALVPREAGSVALATRFTIRDSSDVIEGLVLVMPEPARVRRLLASLELP